MRLLLLFLVIKILRQPEFEEPIGKYAYVTLCSHPHFILNTLVLFHQMAHRNSARGEYVALLTDKVTPKYFPLFRHFNIKTKYIDVVTVTGRSIEKRDTFLWSKLQAWTLVEYEKIVLLDSDIVVIDSLDSLFDYPELSGVSMFDEGEKIAFYDPHPDWVNGKCLIPRIDDPLPVCIDDRPYYENMTKLSNKIPGFTGLNSGLMVLVPSLNTFAEMNASLKHSKRRLCCPSQEFVYRFFESRKRFYRLPLKYHVRRLNRIDEQTRKQLERDVLMFHFVERKKPFVRGRRRSLTRFAKDWWDGFDIVWEILKGSPYTKLLPDLHRMKEL